MSAIISLLLLARVQTPMNPPAVGDMAPAVELKNLAGKVVKSKKLLKQGPVVLVVLRGYPGYQCPVCTRQVGELLTKSDEFSKRKASLLFVYPGPAENLDKYATEFVGSKEFPSNYRFTIDPDFKFTNSYHLRWDAPQETAYPSTFVIAPGGQITYAKISHTHGDRAPIDEVLAALDKIPSKM